MLPNT